MLFDLDGTLVRSAIDFAAMRQGVINLAQEFAAEGLGDKPALELIEEAAGTLEHSDQATSFRQRAAAMLREVELEAASRAELYPWVSGMVAALNSAGVWCGVVTRNCRRAAEMALGHCAAQFAVVLSREEVPRAKPDPSHLQSALSSLPARLEPQQVLVVGDHVMDIVAAKAVGMGAVGVLGGSSGKGDLMAAGADAVLPSAEMLPALLGLNAGER